VHFLFRASGYIVVQYVTKPRIYHSTNEVDDILEYISIDIYYLEGAKAHIYKYNKIFQEGKS
jgi:hypothetical protein